MGKAKLWIKEVVKPEERGRFHAQLGISPKERIPKTLTQKIVSSKIGSTIQNPTKSGKRKIKVTRLMKQRANFALNVGYKKKKEQKFKPKGGFLFKSKTKAQEFAENLRTKQGFRAEVQPSNKTTRKRSPSLKWVVFQGQKRVR